MARDISQKVDEIITGNQDIRIQYEEASKQMRILLRMINQELLKEGEICDTYTLRIAGDHLLRSNLVVKQ